MKWFKHDSDASMDAALQDVLLTYGAEGYGCYWYCVELIAGTIDKHNLTFELEHDARVIARNLGVSAQKVEEMMRHFVSLGLFKFNEETNRVLCLTLARRLDDSIRKGVQVSEIVNKIKDSGVVEKIPKNLEKVPPEEKRREEKRRELESVRDALFLFWGKYYNHQTQPLKSAWKNSNRDNLLSQRISEDKRFLTTDFWEWYLSSASKHPFYGNEKKEAWKKLEWFLKRENFWKVLELINE